MFFFVCTAPCRIVLTSPVDVVPCPYHYHYHCDYQFLLSLPLIILTITLQQLLIFNTTLLNATTSLLPMQYIMEFGLFKSHTVTTLHLCFREAYEFLGSQFYNLHGFFGVWIGLNYIDGSVKWVDGSKFSDTLEGKVSNGCV